MNYLVRNRENLSIQRTSGPVEIRAALFADTCEEFNTLVDKFEGFGVDVFSLLGMRNLSAFIGEMYGAVVIKKAGNLFRETLIKMDIPICS